MIDVRRAADRFRTVTAGVETWHSFSYGPHYDPDNLGFGTLLAHNEDRLDPGAGYDQHAHRGIDIVTWVIAGTLEHEHWVDGHGVDGHGVDGHGVDEHWVDELPARERLTAGCLQVLRTGGGVRHAEHAAGGTGPAGSRVAGSGAHYVQMWVASGAPGARPDDARPDDARPDYARLDASHDWADTDGDGPVSLVTVASGRRGAADGVLALSAPGAELAVARLPSGAQLHPFGEDAASDTESGHLFVTRGAVRLGDDGVTLAAGDALRTSDEPRLTITARSPAEILLWRMH